MSQAKVYLSVLVNEEQKDNTLKALAKANGFLRSELGKRIRFRHIPELIFKFDESIAYGSRIEKLLGDIVPTRTNPSNRIEETAMHTYEQALQAGKQFLLEHDDYLVVSHVQPDGDAVSSTVTVGWLLSCLGKTFTMINEGDNPQRMQFLWEAGNIVNMTEQPPGAKV